MAARSATSCRPTPARRSPGSASAGRGSAGGLPPLGTVPPCCGCAAAKPRSTSTSAAGLPRHSDERTAEMLSAAAGVYTFHHDPGELSAAFVWKHSVRVLLSPPPTARYLIGGWSALVCLAGAASAATRGRGRDRPPRRGPAGRADDRRHRARPGARAARRRLARVAQRQHRLPRPRPAPPPRRPFVVSDLDEAGWVERFSAPDPSLAPDGRGAGAGADADPARRGRRGRRRCASSACSTSRCPTGASARPGAAGR